MYVAAVYTAPIACGLLVVAWGKLTGRWGPPS
jgi:hypothetical protein